MILTLGSSSRKLCCCCRARRWAASSGRVRVQGAGSGEGNQWKSGWCGGCTKITPFQPARVRGKTYKVSHLRTYCKLSSWRLPQYGRRFSLGVIQGGGLEKGVWRRGQNSRSAKLCRLPVALMAANLAAFPTPSLCGSTDGDGFWNRFAFKKKR